MKRIVFLPLSNNYSHLEKSLKSLSPNYKKTVTIVIPFYKGLNILRKTFVSLSVQTYPKDLYELIVVEDGSPKDTKSLINDIKAQISIRRIRQSRQGYRIASARNLGIRNASGEIIVLIDFDVVCPPTFIESHLKWFHISNKIATFGIRKFVDLNNVSPDEISLLSIKDLKIFQEIPSSSNKYRISDKRIPEIKYIKIHPHPYNCFHGCNVAFKRQQAINVGLFDEDFNQRPNYEDLEFGYRLWTSGCYIIYVPNAMVLHQENDIVSYEEKVRGGKINRIKLYQKVPGLKRFRQSIGQE